MSVTAARLNGSTEAQGLAASWQKLRESASLLFCFVDASIYYVSVPGGWGSPCLALRSTLALSGSALSRLVSHPNQIPLLGILPLP